VKDEVAWRYRAVPEKSYHPDIGKYHTYGIQAMWRGSNGRMAQQSIHDVTTDREKAEKMARQFTKHQLCPIHFYDVAEDMLP